MEFLFSFSTWHLMHLLPSLMSYWVEHLKRNSISTPFHVLFSIFFIQSMLHFVMCVRGWRGGGGEEEERGEERGEKFGKFLDDKYWNNMSLQMKNIHSLWPALLRCIWTWVTPPKRVTLPTWSPPPPCKQALNLHAQLQLGGPLWLHLTDYSLFNMMYEL